MSNLTALLNKYKALVIFDTETSGLDFDKDQIIELAALRVERTASGGLRIAGKMDTFIKLPEGETLPENIVSLTGITDALLQTEGVQPAKAASQIAKLSQRPQDRRRQIRAAGLQQSHDAAGTDPPGPRGPEVRTMSKSSPITITSEELRDRVEEYLDRWIPDDVWNRSEPYARRKLDLCRERQPEVEYFNNEYLVLLAADTVRETEFSDFTLADYAAKMAARATS